MEIEDLDYDLIDNVVFGGVDPEDYPDFCDAYIESANYNGVEMTEAQLELLDISYFYENIIESIF